MIDSSFLFDSARALYGLLSYYRKTGKVITPLRYTLELTYRCNLRCPYCYVGDERKKNELTTNEWFDVIDQIPFYGFISLLGGEPLIREDFLEIFEKASKKCINKVNVISNGSLLNEQIINSFIKNKLLLLSISLDGFEKNHDKNRNKEGLYDKVIANLEKLNNSKTKKQKPLLDIKSVVLENNLDDLPKLYKLSNDLNADFFSLAFKRNNMLKQNSHLYETFSEEFYKQEYPIELYFDMEHFREIYKELESQSKSYKTTLRWAPKFKPTGDLNKIEKFFNSGNKPISEIYNPCLYPFSNMYINPEGEVYPCLSYKIGNIKGRKLIDVMNEPKFKCFRKNLKASKLFNSCQMCCEIVPKNQ